MTSKVVDDEELMDKLYTACMEARDKAYYPYSKFCVGAALLAKDGGIIRGCSVDNCAYSLSTCAERCAVVKAVSDGIKEFKAIAVTGKSQNSKHEEKFVAPCGNCRQVLAEFGLDIEVILIKSDKTYKSFSMRELLPEAFTPENLK